MFATTGAGDDAADVGAALEQIEYGVSNVRAIYMHDALLMPRLARVILRSSSAADPFTGDTTFLGQLRDEWQARQTDAQRDEVVLVAQGGWQRRRRLRDGLQSGLHLRQRRCR